MKQRTYRAVHFFEKTGALHNANTVKSQPENYSHFGPLKHTIESSLDKTITSVERVIAIKMRMNAQTARKTYWDACLAWMTKTLVKGDLRFNMVRWESNEEAPPADLTAAAPSNSALSGAVLLPSRVIALHTRDSDPDSNLPAPISSEICLFPAPSVAGNRQKVFLWIGNGIRLCGEMDMDVGLYQV